MNERDKLIELLIKEKGGTRKQYLSLMNKIAHHESAGTMNPKMKQFGNGPGRGKYQFEVGKNKGAITAINRLKRYMDSTRSKIPKWLEEAYKLDNFDASTLTSDQQDMLFLGNMKGHPKADFSKVWSGDESEKDFWAKYHWAGKDKDKKERLKSFDNSMKTFKSNEKSVEKPNYINNYTYSPAVSEDIKGYVPQLTMPDDIASKYRDIKYSSYGMQNEMSLGGKLGITNNKELNQYNEGGSHEANPHGGIPQGIGQNGKMNTVEEGETSFKLDSGKFIFSNRLGLFDTVKLKNKLKHNQFAEGGPTDPPASINKPNNINTLTFNINDYIGGKKYSPTTPGATPTSTKGKQFIEDWFKNPITKSKMQNNINDLNKNYEGNVKESSQHLIDEGLTTTQNTKYKIDKDNSEVGAQFKPYNNTISYYKEPTARLSAHEHSHAMGIDNTMSEYVNKKFGTPSQNAMEKWNTSGDLRKGISENIGKLNVDGYVKHLRYLGNDSEIYPHLMEMREHLKVKPGEVIDDSHINKLMKDKKQKRLFKYYKPSKIKEILNTIASNSTVQSNNTKLT